MKIIPLSLTLWLVATALSCKSPWLVTARDYNRFAIKAQEEGLWREAEHRLRQALAEDPGDPRLHNNLAVALEALGKLEEAYAEYQKAVRLDPGNDVYRRNLREFTTAHLWEYQPPEEEEGAPANEGR